VPRPLRARSPGRPRRLFKGAALPRAPPYPVSHAPKPPPSKP
jgi:hypothetical protein